MTVEVIDPVADYQALMETLFDFDAIRDLFDSGFRMRFDAMHAITGPYAKAILEEALGAPAGDGGQRHAAARFRRPSSRPEPGPCQGALRPHDVAGRARFRRRLRRRRRPQSDHRPQSVRHPVGFARDACRQAHLAPGYAKGLAGIARSMPTSAAADRVAEKLGIDCYETPTGWKFFGNLLDAGLATICGEESAGTGSNHVREKDGLWAVLLWLNILARRRQSVAEIVREHWRTYGRNYYSRHDYEEVDEPRRQRADEASARAACRDCRERPSVALRSARPTISPMTIRSMARGPRGRASASCSRTARASSTGCPAPARPGRRLRVYIERYEPDPAKHDLETQAALAPI